MSYLVPTVIERSREGERAYDLYSRLLKDRIIFVGTAIDEGVANAIIAQLLFLDKEDPEKDITMYINCPGGVIYYGLGILDTMNHIKADVSTVVVGLAASFGALIAANGTKGKRFILPNATVMIHQPWSSGGGGQATDVEISAKEILRQKDILNKILAEKTGQTLNKIEKDVDRDNFMDAKKALEYGLVDKIIQKETSSSKKTSSHKG